jgi:hypothetical protein
MRDGATLKIDDVDEMHPPVTALCSALEFELCDRVHANIYAGWFEQQGFTTHWDDHDVLIAQISGRKRWRVFEPTRKHPLTQDLQLNLPPPSNPCWEGTLHQGDVLHIPRGWWHDAVPLGDPTLHLTIGLYRVTGVDLAKSLITSLAEHEAMRADLPRFATDDERRKYLVEFRQTVDATMSNMTLASYFRELDSMAPGRARPSLPLSVAPQGGTFSDTACVHWLPPRRIQLEDAGDQVAFEAMGSRFSFKKAAAPVLADLASRPDTPFASLCARHRWVGRNDLRTFVLHLISARLVAISDDTVATGPEPRRTP